MKGPHWLALRRPLDYVTAAVLLLAVSPILIATAWLVRRDGGPALFRQARIGRDGQVFHVFKFRSMIVDADNYLDESGMPTRERITKVGKVIRRTSIDELPQLLNILRGEMAIIGPRPILPDMLPFMTEAERKRFSARPGVTGLAQVKGRNMIPWSQRFVLDVMYIENAGILIDTKIALLTVGKVFASSGIATDRNANQVDDIRTRPLPEDQMAQ